MSEREGKGVSNYTLSKGRGKAKAAKEEKEVLDKKSTPTSILSLPISRRRGRGEGPKTLPTFGLNTSVTTNPRNTPGGYVHDEIREGAHPHQEPPERGKGTMGQHRELENI